jgi:hypothetical protein
VIRSVGFFAELNPGWGMPLAGSIKDAVRPAGEPDENRLAAYLRNGNALWSEIGAEPDPLDPEAPLLTGAGSLATDGTWLWREDLPHYVSKYHVALPAEFLAHVRRLGYAPPRLPDATLHEILAQGLGMRLGPTPPQGGDPVIP